MAALIKVGDAVIDLHARAEGISGEISKAISEGGSSGSNSIKSTLSGAMSKVAKVGGAAVAASAGAAAAGVAALTKQAVQSYAEFEQLEGGVKTLFGHAASRIMDNASIAYKTAGLSMNEYMESVNGMAAALNQATGNEFISVKLADQAVIDMADNANKMGTSMESIQNAYSGFSKQNFMMLDNLKLGYGGTKKEMERLLEDATKLSGIEYDIENYADIVNAIHVIQEETGIAGTTAAEATDTITGSLAMTKSAWENIVAGMADENADMGQLVSNLINSIFGTDSDKGLLDNLLPRISKAMDGVLSFVGTALPGLMSRMGEITKEHLPAFLTSVTNVISNLATQAPDMVNILVEIVTSVLNSVNQKLPTVLSSVLNAAIQIVMALIQNAPALLSSVLDVISIVANFILNDGLPMIIDNLPAIIEGIVGFILSASTMITEAVTQILIAVIDMAPEIATQLCGALPSIVSALVSAIASNAPTMSKAIMDLTIVSLTILPAVIVEILSHIPEIFSAIVSGFQEEWPNMKQAGYDAFDNAIMGMFDDGIYASMSQGIAELIIDGIEKIRGFAEDFKNAGHYIMDGLIGGIDDKIQAAKDKLAELGNGIKSKFESVMQIGSPSKVFEQYGEFIDQGLINGITGGTGDVANATGSLTSAVVNGFNPAALAPAYNRTPALAGAGGDFGGIGGEFGSITIPVYIGQKKIETIVVDALNVHNYLTGGR